MCATPWRDASASMVSVTLPFPPLVLLTRFLSSTLGYTGENCDILKTESSAQVDTKDSSSASWTVSTVFLLLLVAIAGAVYYYRSRLPELKEKFFVQFNAYSDNLEPRHFDNPVYSNPTTPLNNASTSSGVGVGGGGFLGEKNTNQLMAKMKLQDLEDDCCNAKLNRQLNGAAAQQGNLYVDMDEEKFGHSKMGNFYHTIEEMKLDKERFINSNNCKSIDVFVDHTNNSSLTDSTAKSIDIEGCDELQQQSVQQ